MDWKKIQDEFPVNKEYIWLNSSGTNPANEISLNAVKKFLDGYARSGIYTGSVDYYQVKKNIRSIIAGLLGCDIEEIAITHNTSEGINFITHGLRLEKGDEVILLENEYPSNYYPWLHLQEKGVVLKETAMASNPEEFIDKFIQVISKKTRVASLSAVHWCTGMPLPLEQIGKICKDRRILLVIDGAQGVGLFDIPVKSLGISFMAFPAWKWLLGPLGLGILFADNDAIESLEPVFMGADSVDQPEEYLPYKKKWKKGADRYTFSTVNFTDWVYFEAGLKFLKEIQFQNIYNRIYELADYLSRGLREIGFKVYSDNFSNVPTGIVVSEREPSKGPDDSHRIVKKLIEKKIICASRLGRIRFSPHIHISFEQIDKALEVLNKLGLTCTDK